MNHYDVTIRDLKGAVKAQTRVYAHNFAEAGERVFTPLIDRPGEYHISVTPTGSEVVFKFNVTRW